MSKSLVNTTLFSVREEIKHILAEQPQGIQAAYAQSDLYQDLLAYVLSRIPNSFVAIEEGQELDGTEYLYRESAERRLQKESIISRGIYDVLAKKSVFAKKSKPICESQNSMSRGQNYDHKVNHLIANS